MNDVILQKTILQKTTKLRQCVLFSGFTFIELIFTLLILSLLAHLAYPQYVKLRVNWDVKTTTQAIQHSLTRLKANALSHKAEMVICGTEDAISCSKDWGQGFMQFPDYNRNRKRDADEPLLESHTGLSQEGRLFTKRKRFFRTWTSGTLASQMGSLWYCPPAQYADLTRRIVISRIGRVRIETREQNPSLTCPTVS